MDDTRQLSVEAIMKSNTLKRAISALALAGMTLPAAAAQPSGWYIGAGAGESRVNIDEKDITADLLASGFTTTSFKEGDRELGYKFLAGYRFNDYFALEGGYFDLGKFDYRATTVPDGTLRGSLEFEGWNLDLLGMLPISERASVFARVGAHRSKAKASFAGTGLVNVFIPSASFKATDYKVGVGYQYSFTDALGLRVEAERYRMDDAVGNKGDIDLFSFGLVYHFLPATVAPRAQTPTTPPPPAKPVLLVVPLPAATQEYCSLLDIQFEIARNEIQLADREKLAVLATFLQRYPETTAVIEGHTDNVGSSERNLQLSRDRAQSVVNYLVSEHRIDRSRLRPEGFGSTRPIATNSTEAGMRANRRIGAIIGCASDIAGLQLLDARMTLAMHIEFDNNSATIGRDYHDQLASVAEFLEANPSVTATMEGHTDNSSPDMAQRISRQRAQSVADYLVQNFDIDRSRLNVQGFGTTRRFNYNTSAEGRQENRRVNIILSYPN